ncbi:MAG TPA: outer membrane beta-barrel protein [Terracidiphilus sp.]|jgi:hypothetical protein|nr:outer membrane beta-barrel protein [Terracidiphilus sp.]
MRRSAVALCFLLLTTAAGLRTAHAQVVEAATARQFRLDAGGMVSGFQSGEDSDFLVGGGTYVDVHFTHWIQLEGEARWLRFNQYYGEHQSNYLIGPRVPIRQLGSRSEIYGKALIGMGKMTFPFGYGYGSFTALAFGATVDYRLSRKVTLRVVDFEYQDWPKWLNNSALYPYGVSAGASYRVF